MAAILQISDGTTTIDLIKGRGEYGFHLESWRPQVVGYKGGGTWQQSALSPGRQIVDKQFENYIDTFTLKANQVSQDTLIYELQEIRRLLEKASSYWTTDWQNEPVYLIAKASDETNTRYALIYTGRIPEDEQPYGQPFLQPLCASVMDNLTLVVEHGEWLADIPGTGTCVQTGVIKQYEEAGPWHLEFDGATAEVNCGSNAAIDDLHSANFSVDGWIYPADDEGYIMSKGVVATDEGWWFEIYTDWSLRGVANYTPVDSRSVSNTVSANTWQHVAMTFNVATLTIRLWVGGKEVSYSLQQVGIIPVRSDAALDLFIGSINAAGFFEGNMGWMRISSGLRYTTASFTPPPQCVLPEIDATTIAQWIGVEDSGATILNQEGTAALDGTQANCTFDSACGLYGNTDGDTCEDEVYIANKQNVANITHIFTWSAANGFSLNLAGFAAFDLIDIAGGAPAVGDYVAFGIDSTLADSGPFASLVFDIGTAISGITVDDWEYSSGAGPAWTNWIGEQDNTNQDGAGGGSAFDTTGVGSAHFPQETAIAAGTGAWVSAALNGVNAFWIRARVTAVPGPHVAPTQQNRQVYSIVWPYIEIDGTQVLGDIAALARVLLRNEVDGSTLNSPSTRFLIGSRSLSRGEDFSAYLNLANEQTPPGITVTTGAAFVSSAEGPSGIVLSYANVPAAWSSAATVTIATAYAQQYIGEYHMFLRGRQLSSGTLSARVIAYISTGTTELARTEEGTFHYDAVGSTPSFVDLGKISLNSAQIRPADLGAPILSVELYGDGVVDAYLYDLILLPVDEWAIDSVAADSSTQVGDRDSVLNSNYLDIDSILYPKSRIRSTAKIYATDLINGIFTPKTPSEAFFQANQSQRLWVVVSSDDGTYEGASISNAHSIRTFKNQRYLSMRGAR